LGHRHILPDGINFFEENLRMKNKFIQPLHGKDSKTKRDKIFFAFRFEMASPRVVKTKRNFEICERIWGGRRDSNPQQQAPQAWTLPLSYDHRPGHKLDFSGGRVKFGTPPDG
jgi:hypothetical protein